MPTDKQSKKFNLGYFLEIRHVKKAEELITLQLKDKSFLFKTIDFQIFRKEKYLSTFKADDFYEEYILKDVFYNYPSLFYNLNYSMPKGAYGIRSFNFMSFHLYILYYSIGFYFLELLKESIDTMEKGKSLQRNIKTYYGGKLNFDSPKNSIITYNEDYSDFIDKIKSFAKEGIENDKTICIVKLDIQDYFNSINTNLLIKVIDKYSLPSVKKKLNYNSSAKDSIKNLFTYINKQSVGLPITTQNIFSNFLSSVFLYDLDNFIQKVNTQLKLEISYLRYIDDIFIMFYQEKKVKLIDIGKIVFELNTVVTDFLLKKMKLKINHLKSENWIIRDEENYKKFLIKEKFISGKHLIKSKDKDKIKPSEKLNEVIEVIKKLKEEFKETGKIEISKDKDIILKEVFKKAVKAYINAPIAKKQLNKAFKKWNPLLTLNSVKSIMILISSSEVGKKVIQDYLRTNLKKDIDTPAYLYLLEKFLNLESYDKSLNDLIDSKKSTNNSTYFSLIQRMLRGSADIEGSYIPINNTVLKENDSLNQQIKMLMLAKSENKYNVAFNHLLNIFHFYCFVKDEEKTVSELKHYSQILVIKYLTSKMATVYDIKFTMSFFDRRNKNNISHPGEESIENWIVTKSEFEDYYQEMRELLIRVIK